MSGAQEGTKELKPTIYPNRWTPRASDF